MKDLDGVFTAVFYRAAEFFGNLSRKTVLGS
jgi:hypothetical protein